MVLELVLGPSVLVLVTKYLLPRGKFFFCRQDAVGVACLMHEYRLWPIFRQQHSFWQVTVHDSHHLSQGVGAACSSLTNISRWMMTMMTDWHSGTETNWVSTNWFTQCLDHSCLLVLHNNQQTSSWSITLMVVVGHGMQTGAHLASWALKAAGFSCSTRTARSWFQSLTVLTANE